MPHNSRNIWWGAPRKFAERLTERKVSWLELFYDLVYAAAVSRLTSHLSHNPTWESLGSCFLFFSLVFWSWVNGSQYYDLHGSDGLRTRLMTFWQMLAVAAVAITMEDAFNGHHHAFSIAFAVIQVLITYLWWSVGLYDPSHRVFNKFYTLNYLIALGLIMVTLFTNYQIALVLYGIVLLLNLTPPLTGARTIVRVMKERGDTFTASPAIIERFGLFTIIVLAESIFGTVAGVASIADKQLLIWLGFMLAILISFLLWCIYFDMTSEQEAKKGYSYMQWFMFLHFPLLASFCVVGSCINIMLSDMGTMVHPVVQWMFCIAITIILFSIVALTRVMEEYEEDRSYIKPVSRILVVIGCALLLVPMAGCYLSNITFLLMIAVLLLIPVAVSVRRWVKYRLAVMEN